MTINDLLDQEIPLSSESFLYMKLLAGRCGIDLDDYRKEAIQNRLMRRLRQLDLDNFDDYCLRLRMDLEEEDIFRNLITNNTTAFFREAHHFEFLATILPELIKSKHSIRIWSAGCSTGEEPYSIAMVIKTLFPNNQHDFKILATDISSDAIIAAERGIYSSEDLDRIPQRMQKFFSEIPNTIPPQFQIDNGIKGMVSFHELNLLDSWSFQNHLDIIFCRNVIIYFKKDVSQKILENFNDVLEPDGYLFLGHSENLQSLKDLYRNKGKTIYQKIR